MAQKVVTKSTAAAVTVSPLARVLRTVLQAVAAFAAAEPVLIAGLGFTGVRASEIAGVVAALVAVASGIQNIAEKFGWISVSGGKTPAVASTK